MRIKVVPPTLLGKFEAAQKLSRLAGFAIFPPSRRYFRAEDQFIAVKNDATASFKDKNAKGVFRLWIRKGELWIEFYPFFENNNHKKFLEEELETTIRQRHYNHKPLMRRFDPAHKMVAAPYHQEFELLINPPVRLP